MKGIIVHEAYKDKPIFININAINVVKTDGNKYYEYTEIYVGEWRLLVKEPFDIVIAMIQKAESEDKT